ncbi:MAG: nitroreductase family deazaflavin-dependent oxidoreductase [Chloroflexi bacterium]|nr:nitroreductase family deazaflavin-dependent oxidoreductase [Chloroflexota bacterium]
MPSKLLLRGMKVANRLHVGLYRLTSGKLANQAAGMPLLLITTTGRKSGKPHTNPIVYIEESQEYLVSASAGGMTWNPGWYFNLTSHPDAKIQVGSQKFNVKATIIEGEERNRLYEMFKAASSNFVKYEKSANRTIPVIRLTRTDK